MGEYVSSHSLNRKKNPVDRYYDIHEKNDPVEVRHYSSWFTCRNGMSKVGERG
jgi:hypothetical protein